MKYFEEAIDEVFSELKSVLIKKQKDYGHNNILLYGKTGVQIRVTDKMMRLHNLWLQKKEPNNESVIDSWVDVANYAIIWLMLNKGIFELPLKDDN